MSLLNNQTKPIPWDAAAFGMDAYEIVNFDETVFAELDKVPGHYTIRINPLDIKAKQLLQQHQFYYCDTLIKPYLNKEFFNYYVHPEITMHPCNSIEEIIFLIEDQFKFNRYHRDFNIPNTFADVRYKNWMSDLIAKSAVHTFQLQNKIISFIAIQNNKIELYATDKSFQEQGLSKFCWSLACDQLIKNGYDVIDSCISAANLPILNLHVRMGFKFKNAVDVYHRVVTKQQNLTRERQTFVLNSRS